jgi:hypothetical protein
VSNVGFSQFDPSFAACPRVPSTFNAIASVVARGSGVQVIRVAAGRVVADVQHI